MRAPFAIVAIVALAGCQMDGAEAPRPSAVPPVGVELEPPLLRLINADGTTCDVAVPADLVEQRGWMGEAPHCRGINAIEISFPEPDEPVILRIAEYTGYITTRGIPDGLQAWIWVTYGEGYWAQY
jgi:hypothetical protein